MNTAITIKLVGTTSPRDPVGASVTTAGQHASQYRQLTAGCGYQAQNEKALVFARKNTEKPMQFDVMWPSGTSGSETLYTDSEWMLVERHGFFSLPR